MIQKNEMVRVQSLSYVTSSRAKVYIRIFEWCNWEFKFYWNDYAYVETSIINIYVC
jgi:hypothetical protein